jgi:hypothetical protein
MEQKQHLEMNGIYHKSSKNTHIQYHMEPKQHLEMNRIYNQSSNNTHIQCQVEQKQHLEMNGIYNQSSNNTHANIRVPQIRAPSCTTLFLMCCHSPSNQLPHSTTPPLDCNNCQ